MGRWTVEVMEAKALFLSGGAKSPARNGTDWLRFGRLCERGVFHRSSIRTRSMPSKSSSTSAAQSESGADGLETEEEVIAA